MNEYLPFLYYFLFPFLLYIIARLEILAQRIAKIEEYLKWQESYNKRDYPDTCEER